MNVEPAKFTLRKNVKIPDNNLTAHLPPANLRESADRVLDKLEKGGLIKKAPRICQYKSKAFFKPKRNNEARLLVDYKASQVNNLIQRPTHPQFGVEQLVQQVKPGMQYFLSADLTVAYFCYPLQEGPQRSRPHLLFDPQRQIYFQGAASRVCGFPGFSRKHSF